MIIDPRRVYQSNQSVTPVRSAPITVLTVGTNRLIVTAVAGKVVRVMGWDAQSVGAAAGSFQLKSASAGTMLMPPRFSPPVTAGASNQLPITNSGYFETNAGEGLYADIVTADQNLIIFYIIALP